MTYEFAAKRISAYMQTKIFSDTHSFVDRLYRRSKGRCMSDGGKVWQILILFLVVSKKRPYLSRLAVLFAGFGVHTRSHRNDELQMFTEYFVSAKLENITVTLLLSSFSLSPQLCICFHSAVSFAWMAVNFKVSLLCVSVSMRVCLCMLNWVW